MEHDGKDEKNNFDETLESLGSKEAVDNLIKGEIKQICEDTPASGLKAIPVQDRSDWTAKEKFLGRREKPAAQAVNDAVVSSESSTSSTATDPVAPGQSSSVSDAAGETSPQESKPEEPPVRGSGNFDAIEVDHLAFAKHPDEYFEKVEVRKAPMFGYYIPPPTLVRWDLVEEERLIFAEHQTAYIADVIKVGHLEAAKAASIKIHQLARGIQLANKAIDSLNQSRRESVHLLSGSEYKEYEKLNEEERAKWSHKKPKGPGKASGKSTTTTKVDPSRLDAATRKRVRQMLDGYVVMELEKKDVITKLTNKGFYNDETAILVNKLFKD